jgi:hypothetical protein
MATPKGDKEIFQLLRDAEAKEVYRYVGGVFIGTYWVKEVVWKGGRILQEVVSTKPGVKTDYCMLCGWQGPSEYTDEGSCPKCGGRDLEDRTGW